MFDGQLLRRAAGSVQPSDGSRLGIVEETERIAVRVEPPASEWTDNGSINDPDPRIDIIILVTGMIA
jgi:hypothetical protein